MPVDVKRLIAETLLETLKKKRLEKITVKELVDACGISRQTFYYHFKDVLDVVEWWSQEVNKRLVSASLKAENAHGALAVFLDFAIQHHEVVQSLLESRWRAQMEALMVNTVSAYLKDMLQHVHPNAAIPSADLEAYLDFYSYGITGMIFEHASKGSVNTDALVEQMYCVLFNGGLENILNARP